MSKIKSLNYLLNFKKKAKKLKKKLILCHGNFDLIHFGHLNHFKKAKKLGDYLVVSITSDKFIKKGLDRPFFKQRQRLEFLSHLSMVDFVYLDDNTTAKNLISKLKPDFYVKGNDYKKFLNKKNTNLFLEKKAVEKYGGKFFLTNEESFSSSNLINQNILSNNLRSKIKNIKKKFSHEKIVSIIENISKLKILIIGDTILDQYNFVDPLGKPSKENIIATLYEKKQLFAGGIFSSINTMSTFCDNIDFITTVGNDKLYFNYLIKKIPKNINKHLIYKTESVTTRKIRYVEKNQFKIKKLFEVYKMNDNFINKKIENKIDNYLKKNLRKYDIVLVHDYGHGLLTKKIIDTIQNKSKYLCVNAQLNAGNKGYNLITKYQKAKYYCLDIDEARMAVNDKNCIDKEVPNLLMERLNAVNLAVTTGSNGSISKSKNKPIFHMPSFSNVAVDTMGAGDAYYILSSPILYLTNSIELASLIGNLAGSLKIRIPGHQRRIEKKFFLENLNSYLKTEK